MGRAPGRTRDIPARPRHALCKDGDTAGRRGAGAGDSDAVGAPPGRAIADPIGSGAAGVVDRMRPQALQAFIGLYTSKGGGLP
ncbi:hypothetical protein IBTHAUMO2_240097 [Nitrosopumilaceae archaeon]|nr:hypothetical protein IBTHAUMO2_240097 [Nitrosopumilaceae archaeon]